MKVIISGVFIEEFIIQAFFRLIIYILTPGPELSWKDFFFVYLITFSGLVVIFGIEIIEIEYFKGLFFDVLVLNVVIFGFQIGFRGKI